MSVKVKRKLWIFAAFIPLRIRYNNKSVGTLYGSQEVEIPGKDEGELKYHQPIGRDDQLSAERIALGGLLIVALIGFFFKTHKLVLLNT